MALRRWICPRCGSGVNAPERPRLKDVRRYCLACSADTGSLVERTCPALERRREAGRLRSQGKQQAKREREHAKYLMRYELSDGRVVELDLLAETKRALKLMGAPRAARGVRVDVRRRTDGMHSGRANPWTNRIVLGVSGFLADDLLLVYHEAAHIAAGHDPSDRRRWHGELFHRTLADAIQKRFPFVVYGSVRSGQAYYGTRVREQLREHFKSGGEFG